MRNLLTPAISAASLSLIFGIAANSAMAENNSVELDSQQISGGLYSDPVGAAAFNVTVLERADLELLPVNNVIDALEYVSGLDVRQRGIGGTQADISIRGSSYEQTLVLLDGMRMNDPQTGHHNLDIPIAFEDVDRIEIVKGPGANQYGPSSNGGVINIVSRKSVETHTGRNAEVGMEVGSYNHKRYMLNLAKTEGSYSQFLSLNHSAADSYIRDETLDSSQDQGSYRVVHQGETSTTQAAYGYLEKEFGAYRFYVDSEAQSNERTAQRHGYITHQSRFGEASDINASINWRNHFDDYRYTPASNPSKHETEALQSRVVINKAALSAGIEYNDESLVSNRDGSAGRHYSSLFALYNFELGRNASLSTTISGLDYDSREQYALPVIGIDMLLSEYVEVYANMGLSVRTPTMNELYLDMASNQGNEDLDVERTSSSELGIRLASSNVNVAVSIFYKETQDAIDFTKTQTEIVSNSAYKARNYGDNTIKGYDIEFDISALGARYLNMNALKLTHTRIHQDLNTDLIELKNTQSQLENQTAIHAGFNLSQQWSLVSAYSHEKRFNSDEYQILDMGLNYQASGLKFSVDGSNLLDAKYIDGGFVPAAGPALILGLGYEL